VWRGWGAVVLCSSGNAISRLLLFIKANKKEQVARSQEQR
jgi:hypothetical protein